MNYMYSKMNFKSVETVVDFRAATNVTEVLSPVLSFRI